MEATAVRGKPTETSDASGLAQALFPSVLGKVVVGVGLFGAGVGVGGQLTQAGAGDNPTRNRAVAAFREDLPLRECVFPPRQPASSQLPTQSGDVDPAGEWQGLQSDPDNRPWASDGLFGQRSRKPYPTEQPVVGPDVERGSPGQEPFGNLYLDDSQDASDGYGGSDGGEVIDVGPPPLGGTEPGTPRPYVPPADTPVFKPFPPTAPMPNTERDRGAPRKLPVADAGEKHTR